MIESDVKYYSRLFSMTFTHARNAIMYDQSGGEYIDFLSGAGALNYGHNHPQMKKKLIEYIETDGILHSLDLQTEARQQFIRCFEKMVLPVNARYKFMFPGPTGTNAVEAAIKIARRKTGRQAIACFTNGFHGMTCGALALSGNKKNEKRQDWISHRV